jgi:hypothetical protein
MSESGETKSTDTLRKNAYHKKYMARFPEKRRQYQDNYYRKRLAAFKPEVDPNKNVSLDTNQSQQDVEIQQPEV